MVKERLIKWAGEFDNPLSPASIFKSQADGGSGKTAKDLMKRWSELRAGAATESRKGNLFLGNGDETLNSILAKNISGKGGLPAKQAKSNDLTPDDELVLETLRSEYRRQRIKSAVKASLMAAAIGGVGSAALSGGSIPAGLIGAAGSGIGTFAINMI